MTRNRFLAAGAALAAAAVLMTGCGSGKKQTETAGSETAAETSAAESSTEAAAEAAAEEESAAEEEASEETGEKAENNGLLHITTTKFDDNRYEYVEGLEEYSHVSAEVAYAALSLDEEDAAEYPELAEALKEFSENAAAEYKGRAQETIEQLLNDFQSDFKDGYVTSDDDMYRFQTTDCREARVRRADSSIVSFEINYEGYAGGAHGYYSTTGYNIDSKTGKMLKEADVFKDTEELHAVIKKELLEAYDEDELSFMDDYFNSIENPEKGSDYIPELNFILTYDGAEIIFNPYDIAPFASGAQMITLSYSDYADLFKEDYSRSAAGVENYIEPICMDAENSIDVDGDGSADSVLIETVWNEEGGQHYKFHVNGTETELGDDVYAYSINPYYVCSDGSAWIWLFGQGDDDYVSLYVYGIADNKPVFKGTVGLQPAEGYFEDGEVHETVKYSFNDPSEMKMLSRHDFLGTYSASKIYRTGKDGMPVSDDKWFTLEVDGFEMTAAADFIGSSVDEDGNVSGDYEIKTGDKVSVVRTDSETFVDVRVNGSDLVRLDYNADEWPHLINGVDENTLFEMIPYAG